MKTQLSKQRDNCVFCCVKVNDLKLSEQMMVEKML